MLSDGEETTDFYPVTVSLMSYSDYGGSDFDAANVRWFEQDGTPGVTVQTIAYGGKEAITVLGELPEGDDVNESLDRLELLVQIMQGLDEYAVISEETHSEYVEELAQEAWDQYLSRDVRAQVERELTGYDGDLDDFKFTDDEIRDLYYDYDDNHFYCESATSVINDRHEEAVENIVSTIVAAWRTPAVDPNQLEL